jgi:hypothetical protein
VVCENTALHVLVCTSMYRDIPDRYFQNMIYTSIYCIKELMVFHSGGIILGGYMEVYTSHVQHNTSWCFKCKITYVLASSVRTMYIHVHAGIYCHVRIHTKVKATFHFESGLIRLETPTSFQSTLDPFIVCSNAAAFFLSAVSFTFRPPRCGLQRPNCHSQGLTS